MHPFARACFGAFAACALGVACGGPSGVRGGAAALPASIRPAMQMGCMSTVPSPLPSPIARAVAAALAAASGEDIPGGMIGIASGGQFYQYYWGYADRARQTCMSANTVVEIGSLTKTFTATLLALAYERGKLSPQQNPSRWIDVLGAGNAVGKSCPPAPTVTPVPRSDYGVMTSMTLEMLATHTSGLPDDPFPVNDLRERPCYSPDQFVAFVETYPTSSPIPTPPHPWSYSNAGFGALGYALQGANRTPWIVQVQREILAPLNMTHTYGQGNVPPEHYAVGYDCDGNVPVIRWPVNAWPAAGSLRSTLPDMLAYLAAAMQRPGTPPQIARAMKLAETPTGVLTPTGGRQALAWTIDSDNGITVIDKDGDTNGFNAYVAMAAPSSGTPQTGVVVLINRAGVAIEPTPSPSCAPADGIPSVNLGVAALEELQN